MQEIRPRTEKHSKHIYCYFCLNDGVRFLYPAVNLELNKGKILLKNERLRV